MKDRIEKMAAQMEPTALATLEDLVNQNSFTSNWEGVAATGRIIQETAARLGMRFEATPALRPPTCCTTEWAKAGSHFSA